MQNREILMLLELSKTLVYSTTSLKWNEIVMEKLTTLPRIKQYAEDEDLLDDVITENKQAIEMANIYSGVLANMTDAFALPIVSNNLNNVMRIFTIISITLSIPTLIFSMSGMNFQEGMLGMPLTDKPWGFAVIIGISLVVSAIVHLVPDTFTHVQVESRRIARMSRLSRNILPRRWYAPLRSYWARARAVLPFPSSPMVLLKGRPLRLAWPRTSRDWVFCTGESISGFDISVSQYVANTLGFAQKQIVFKQVLPSTRVSRRLKTALWTWWSMLLQLMTFRMVRLSLQDRI